MDSELPRELSSIELGWEALTQWLPDIRASVERLAALCSRPERWHRVPLGEILTPSEEPVAIVDGTVYRRPKVHVGLRGVALRDEVDGAFLRVRTQNRVRAGQFLLSLSDARHGGYGFAPIECEGAIVSTSVRIYDVDFSTVRLSLFEGLMRTDAFLTACRQSTGRPEPGVRQRTRLDEQRLLAETVTVPIALEDQDALTEALARFDHQRRALEALAEHHGEPALRVLEAMLA